MNTVFNRDFMRVLSRIMKEKVITETELLKLVRHGMPVASSRLNEIYHIFVLHDLPIKRKCLFVTVGTGSSQKGGVRRINHRVVIYYVY